MGEKVILGLLLIVFQRSIEYVSEIGRGFGNREGSVGHRVGCKKLSRAEEIW